MDALKIPIACLALLTLSSCQMGYLVSSAYHQLKMLNQREPVANALEDPRLSETEKEKLRLSQEARVFAETKLGLTHTDNYTSFVKLDRGSVTYVVSAAAKWELKPYLWKFPIVGAVPYKGYFNDESAKEEEESLKLKGYDTYRRGVSAYSTLGWFNDPITSPMLNYKPHDLVNTIIHETVHATMYFKSNADFNERIAVFLGNIGTELFYLEKEGPDSPTLELIKKENADDKTFSEFISAELKALEEWYQTNTTRQEPDRLARIKEIQSKFQANISGKLLSGSYKKFHETDLNNARLLVYKTYVSDLKDFESLYNKVGGDFRKFIEAAKSCEKSKDPVRSLKEFVGQ